MMMNIMMMMMMMCSMPKEEQAPPQREWETTHTLSFTKPSDDPEHRVPIGSRQVKSASRV